jgi:hypothetical protein
MNERPASAGFWTTIFVAAALFVYPLSFGPACWITSHAETGETMLSEIYKPILWIRWNGPEAISEAIDFYSHIGARQGWTWWIHYTFNGRGQRVELKWDGPMRF